MIQDQRLFKMCISLAFVTLAGACSDDERLTLKEPVVGDVRAGEVSPEDNAEVVGAQARKIDQAAKTIYFAFDATTLDAPAQSSLADLAKVLKGDRLLFFTIEGHADERGSTEYNLALGERRAHAVKKYLINLGIDSSRLRTTSFGEESPAVDGKTEKAWSKNRRAAFVKAIGHASN